MAAIRQGYAGARVIVRLNADRIIALMVVATALCLAGSIAPV